MFPVGSWWVYEDSITGDKDSIVLTKQETFIEKPSHVHDFYWENLRHEFYSLYCGSYKGIGSLYQEDVYSYNSGLGFFITQKYNSNLINYTFFDSINFNNNTYNSVRRIEQLSPYISATYYWSYKIGLVRKENPINNNIWNLKSFHINN